MLVQVLDRMHCNADQATSMNSRKHFGCRGPYPMLRIAVCPGGRRLSQIGSDASRRGPDMTRNNGEDPA